MINLIGISGRIGSGKDLTGNIIQMLTSPNYKDEYFYKIGIDVNRLSEYDFSDSSWEIKKFANKLKDIVCILIGCTREQLEDSEFKNNPLGEEWRRWYWSYYKLKNNNNPRGQLSGYYTSEEEANKDLDLISRITHNAHLESEILTPRLIMQITGTEFGRKLLTPKTWVNSLFSEYKVKRDKTYSEQFSEFVTYNQSKVRTDIPKWIITDLRFPNEFDAIKQRNGICIRVNRPISSISQRDWEAKCPCCKSSNYSSERVPDSNGWAKTYKCSDCNSTWSVTFGDKMGGGFDSINNIIDNRPQHESETALDNHRFDYVINNDSNIEDLIEKVKQMLIYFKIL